MKYTYNAQSIRTAKQVNHSCTLYLLDGDNVAAEVQNSAVTNTYLRGVNLIRRVSGKDADPLDANPFRYCGEYLDLETGENQQAHHVLPKKYEDQFLKAGLDIHNPKYGSWVESTRHARFSYAYNQDWFIFFDIYKSNDSADLGICASNGSKILIHNLFLGGPRHERRYYLHSRWLCAALPRRDRLFRHRRVRQRNLHGRVLRRPNL